MPADVKAGRKRRQPQQQRERKLPAQQLAILALCRFAEPIATTSLLPYLPEMVESFHIPKSEVGKWAGITSAMFSLSQAVVGVPWGRLSDRYGRKPAILFGLTSTMIMMLVWGFSTSLPMAMAARALAGGANGNVGILRTTVAEMVPYKELQPFAFSLMPLVWNVGSVFGPMLGGALANPLSIEPSNRPTTGSLLEVYPYALPNIVAAVIFTIGILTGIFFLEETMEGAKDRTDYGLILGRRFTRATKQTWARTKRWFHKRNDGDEITTDGEREPLLRNGRILDEEDGSPLPAETKPKQPPPGWREVLNRQAVLNLVAYTMLACHTMAFDQLLPVFFRYPPIGSPEATPYSFPLRFAGGFGLDHFSIGLIATCNGIVGMIWQFFIFPPLARRYGARFWLRIVACIFPAIYFLTPFSVLFPTQTSRIAVQMVLMVLKNLAGTFAFPCSTILLTNSASSLRTLGTLNGMATSTAALGRAAGPATAGAMFSFGVKAGYVIAPWWLITAFAMAAAIPAFWVEEGEGFGGDDGNVEDIEEGEEEEEEEEEEERELLIETAALDAEASAAGSAGPIVPPQQLEEAERRASANGSARDSSLSLSRTATLNSEVVAEEDEEESPDQSAARSSRQATGMDGAARVRSQSRRRIVTRKTSMPIGTGKLGVARRYSSNLGQSLGSAGSQHGY